MADFIQKLTNCTSDAPDTADDGANVTVIVTASSGYIFTTQPTAKYMRDDTGYIVTVKFTISSDGKTATGELQSVCGQVKITATAVVSSVSYPVILNLTNCTSDAPVNVEGGVQITIKVTANDGYLFNETPYIEYTDDTGRPAVIDTGVLNGVKTICTLNFTTPTGVTSITVVGNGVSEITSYRIKKQLVNCTSDAPDTINPDETIKITVTAIEGYILKNIPSIIYYDYLGRLTVIEGVLNSTSNKCTIDFTAPTEPPAGDITLDGTGEQIPPYIVNYGGINVYSVTPEILDAFSKERFVKSTTQDGMAVYTDLGDFVLKLHRVYCNIGQTVNSIIKAGVYTTTIQASTPKEDIQLIDFGGVLVPNISNDVVDYESIIKIFLPFYGFVDLDTNLVMGKTVKLKYQVNIITGDCNANISLDDVIIDNKQFKLISDVLYRTYADKNMGDLDFNERSLMGFVPYILVQYHNSKMVALYEDNNRDQLNNFNGLHRFKDIEGLSSDNMLEYEYNEILKMLEKGVIL